MVDTYGYDTNFRVKYQEKVSKKVKIASKEKRKAPRS